MQKEMSKFRVVETRVCPTCNASYDVSSSDSHCPNDQSLLCPVNSGYTTQMVAGWKVLELIGEGSSGRVYKARQEETNVIAAIKFLKLNLQSDPTAVKRFQQEALAIKELNNASITALYDFGIIDDGTPFLIMEFVEGQTLQTILEQQGALDEDAIRTMFIQVADAMLAAHAKGILHRDLKPGNLIVDARKNVKVVDFGLAKFCDTETAASVTRTGIQLGTPAYMSPEQCTGVELDKRTDIYSLGCVLYECLTGKQVFDTDKAVAFYHKHAFEEPLPPSKHLGRSSHASSKGFKQLEQIVMACLQKEREDRIQSMQELTDCLKGKKVRRIKKRARVNIASFLSAKTAAVASIAVLLAATAVFVSQYDSAGPGNKPLSFTPPHTVYTKETQKRFATQQGLFMLIDMDERLDAGFNDKSSIYRESNKNNLKEAMNSAAARECFSAWRGWYSNVFSYLRANGALEAPADIRMKVTVTVDRAGKISAISDWADPTSDDNSRTFMDQFLNSIQKLDRTKLMSFPSANVDSVNFEIYLGREGELRVTQVNQALR